jgi:AGZA family xanthine/uracil permease-like MFS transporter
MNQEDKNTAENVGGEVAAKRGWLDRTFKLKENGTTVRTEIIAGITTFMTMVYILMVNAGMFSNPFGDGTNVLGVSYGAIYIATALSAIIGTVLIGLLSNLPLAQASGMGLNAFFVYTICVGLGLSYANTLVLVLIDGIVFVILTITGLRKMIFDAIPKAVRVAIPAGIGLFIAFIGLQNAGIVVLNESTKVSLVSLNVFNGTATWASIMPILVTFLTFIGMAVLSKLKVKGSILWGMLGGAAIYYLLGLTIPEFFDGFTFDLSQTFTAFGDWGREAVGKVFTDGFDFSGYLDANGTGNLILVIITTSLAFCMVDMFDTIGTLYGACARGNMLDKDGNVPNMDKAMLADAIATCAGAIAGTSTVTTYVESSAGIAEGGKTGLTSIVISIGFLIAMFLSPIAQLIPSVATAAALIYVGVLMMNGVKEIEWTDPAVAVPAFLTLSMMSFTYNISYGIGLGIISYVLIKLFTGKIKEINWLSVVIGLLFAATFFLTH